MSLNIKEKTQEISSLLKLGFRTLIAYFFAVFIFIPILICNLKNKQIKFELWFIFVSTYQKDIIFNLFKQKYSIDLYRNLKKEIHMMKIYQLSFNKEIYPKEIKNEYNLVKIKNIFQKIITLKLNLPQKIYLSSVSPLLFPNPFVHSIFLVYKYLKLVRFIDDGLSGNIFQNRLQNLKYCPEPNYIYTWNFKNYFNLGNKISNKKLDFKILYKLISDKELPNESTNFDKKNLVISSKYLDYDLTRQKISINKDYKKSTIYIPHPRGWKNSSYFLSNFSIIKTKFVESWILKNSFHVDNIYIGVSATTLIIAELKLIKKNQI